MNTSIFFAYDLKSKHDEETLELKQSLDFVRAYKVSKKRLKCDDIRQIG